MARLGYVRAFALLGDQKRDLASKDDGSFEGSIAPDASALLTIDVIDAAVSASANAVIGRGAIVAANSVVLNNMVVPAGALAVGAPAVIKEGRARLADIEMAVNAYVAKTARFKKELRRID